MYQMRRAGLKTKIIVMVSSMFITLMIIVSTIIFYNFKDRLRQVISQQQFMLVSEIAGSIDERIGHVQQEIVEVAREMPRDIVNDPRKVQKHLEKQSELLATFDAGVSLVGVNGRLIAELPYNNRHTAADLTSREYFKDTIKSRQPVISDPYFKSGEDKLPVVAFTAPVLDSTGKTAVMLIGRVDLLKPNFLGKLSSIKIGKSGYLYMNSRDGVMILHPDMSRILKKDVPTGSNIVYQKSMKGFEGTDETVTSRGIPMLTSVKRLRTTGWILGAHYPQSEAYEPILRARQAVIFGNTAGISAIVFLVWLFLKHLTNPLVLLTQHMRNMHDKKGEEKKIRLNADDEIGELARAFNDMVDELEQQKNDLAKSEELYKTVTEFSNDMSFWIAGDGGLRYVSPNCKEITGHKDSEFYEKPGLLSEIIHHEDQSLWQTQVSGGQCGGQFGGESKKTRLRIIAKSGSVKWVELICRPVYNELHEYAGYRGSCSDITDAKKAEDELRRSEELFSKAFHSSPDWITINTLTDGRFVDVNDAFLKITGFSRGEVIGNTVLNLKTWSDPEEQKRFVRLVSEKGYVREFEATLKTRSGEKRLMLLSAELLNLPDEQCVIVISRDITERKKSEMEIVRQNEYLEALHQTTLGVISRLNLNELFNVIISRAAGLVGTKHGFIYVKDPEGGGIRIEAGIGMYGTLLGFRQKKGEGLAGKVMESGKPMVVDDYQLWSERLYYPHLNAVRAMVGVPLISSSEVVGVIGLAILDSNNKIGSDELSILNRFSRLASLALDNARLYEGLKNQLNELRRSEAQIRKLSRALEQSPVSVMITDRRGRIEYVNPGFTEMTGYVPDEVIGRKPRDMNLGEMPESEYRQVRELIAAGSEWRGEFQNRKKGGEIYWEYATISAIRSNEGIITHYVTMAEDVSDKKQRVREMEAVVRISAAMRTARSRSEMLRIILDQMMELLDTEGSAIAMKEAEGTDLLFELGKGLWEGWTGLRIGENEGVTGHVLLTGEPYLTNNVKDDKYFIRHDLAADLSCAACVPLIVQGSVLGVLWVGRSRALGGNDLKTMIAMSDIAANAIQRVTLHERTVQDMRRLAALHSIDLAITSNLNLESTLDTVLEHIVLELNMDAADVLLLSGEGVLEYAAGRGFRRNLNRQTRLGPGESLAGEAAQKRKRFYDLEYAQAANSDLPRSDFIAGESFVFYCVVPLVARDQVKGVLEIYRRKQFVPEKEWLEFMDALAVQTAIAVDNAMLFEELEKSNMELIQAYDATIEGWTLALDLRDEETAGHTQRVTDITVNLARALGVTEPALSNVRRGAILHDIGKMGVPDNVLLKPGPLDERERMIMSMHPVYAYEMLSHIPYLKTALDIPYAHHEKWDGTGYPRGLKGEEIPLSARIFAVVDVWDALRSDRPYREAWTESEVREYVHANAGTHFDPRVVDAFLLMVGDGSVR